MKKLLAMLLTGAISVCGAFAFAACNPDGGDGRNKQEKQEEQGNHEEQGAKVTADGWKNALSYFKVNCVEESIVLSDNPRINFSCKMNISLNYGEEHETDEITLREDFETHVAECAMTDFGGKPATFYLWQSGEKYYDVGGGWNVDQNTEEAKYHYTKKLLSEEEFKKGFDANIYTYAGGDHILALSLADKFADFTYSEEKEEYTATMEYPNAEVDANVTVKFENGKLKYMSVASNDSDGSAVYAYSYSYVISVTVPEYYINLQIGDTQRTD